MSPGRDAGLPDMRTLILVPGAGGAAWYWHRVEPLLRAQGHHPIAVDLPGPDPDAGLDRYADLLAAAADGATEIALVAQSMGAFPAVMACSRLPATHLVLLNAMVPAPGETPTAWWTATGSEPARVAAARDGGYPATMDLQTLFLHDVPTEIWTSGAEHERPEADRAFADPCDVTAWPDVPTTVIAGRDDRLFPLGFQRRVARERLGLDVVEVPGGHLAALSRPEEVAAAIGEAVTAPVGA